MASKLMASSTSRDSDLKRKLSMCSSTSSAADFLRIDSCYSARDNSDSDSATVGCRGSFVGRDSGSDQGQRQVVGVERNPGALLNGEIAFLDAVGAVAPASDCEKERPRIIRRTADDVWREILAGKRSEQKPKEEMMTLEDFLAKAGAMEAAASASKDVVAVKEESGCILTYGSNPGVIGMRMGVVDVGAFDGVKGKRSVSLLEPLDRVAQQRQRRMIKNRESAARSRERKQAHRVELESMVARLEEENMRLLQEMSERTKKRLKQLMENVIPVVEKRNLPRLRRVRSTQW